MPEISVLMSCYNASKYLAEAIESILNQTFDNFEFIAIDDGSRDNTSDILKDYARADSRIILLEKENTGLTNSLNIGLKTARGKWIARMDADDVSLPNRFEDQLEFVQVHAGVILLGTSCIVIDQSGKEIRRYEYTAVHHQLIKKILRGFSFFPHSSALFLREPVLRIGAYRERLNGAEDKDLWFRLSSLGRIYCMKEPLIKLRKHAESVTVENQMSLLLAYAASISYLLRTEGYADPVDMRHQDYHLFLSWLEQKLVQEQTFEIVLCRSKLLQAWRARAEENLITRGWSAARNLALSSLGYKAAYDYLFGSALSARLAKEWREYMGRESGTLQ